MIPETMLDVVDDMPTWMSWFESLSTAEREQMQRQLEGAPKVSPNKGPQTVAYSTPALVTGYGGAAGGGKSSLLAMLAYQMHQRSIIYRANASDMENILDDLEKFSGGDKAGRNLQSGRWYFSDRPGHMVRWAGISKPGSETRLQGHPFDFIGVDEATQIARFKLEYLRTWNRSIDPKQRVRCLYTFNPPGENNLPGVDPTWVIDYFAPWVDERHENPATLLGEIRYFIPDEETGLEDVEVPNGMPVMQLIGDREEVEVIPEPRTFIPARVDDNPFLARTGYKQQLLRQKEPYKSQMLFGDFRRAIIDQPFQLYPGDWIKKAQDRWRPDGRYRDMDAVGVDPARGGKASTVFSRRHGFWWDELVRVPGFECNTGRDVGTKAIMLQENDAPICIDSNGIGASPYDFLTDKQTVEVIGSKGQESAPHHLARIDHQKMANLRVALMWCLRKILDPDNGVEPALPNEKRLRSQMVIPTFFIQAKKLHVTTKEDMEEIYGQSIDDLDAVLQTLMNIQFTDGYRNILPRPVKNILDEARAQRRKRPPAYMEMRGGRKRYRSNMWLTS